MAGSERSLRLLLAKEVPKFCPSGVSGLLLLYKIEKASNAYKIRTKCMLLKDWESPIEIIPLEQYNLMSPTTFTDSVPSSQVPVYV